MPDTGVSECLDGCSQCCCPPLNIPFDDLVMTPFVEVKVIGNGQTVSVGNNSSPPNNHAVISSFKYGNTTSNSGGCMMEIEIVDEAGSKIQNFFDRMATIACPQLISSRFWITATWGWIATNCDGTSRPIASTTHTVQMISLDVVYGKGVTKFAVKGIDQLELMKDAGNFGTLGTDTRPVHLKDAIRELVTQNGCNVSFMRAGSTDRDAWGFNVGGRQGPLGSWRKSGNNFIQTILSWISPFRTDADKGVNFCFNSRREGGTLDELILWESDVPNPGERVNPCSRTIGTFIVNGGSRSPVIDFSPTMNWTWAGSSTGGTMNQGGKDASIEKPNVNMGQCGGPQDQATWRPGQPTFGALTSQAVDAYGIAGATEEIRKSTAQHSKANPTPKSVEAELRIQGQPALSDPVYLRGKSLSLIVVQPFHHQATGDGCGEWLQTEPCNKILSNRAWLIMGSGHEIKSGSYTTTIKIRLDAPGADIDVDSPLGGDPQCGYIKAN